MTPGRTPITLLAQEDGATAIEYALIGGLISVLIVGAVTTIGAKVLGMFTAVVAAFT